VIVFKETLIFGKCADVRIHIQQFSVAGTSTHNFTAAAVHNRSATETRTTVGRIVVLIAVTTKSIIFLDVTPFILIDVNRLNGSILSVEV
jgi:hypothetical protein